MKQHSIHTEMITQVAEKLGPLRQKVVFLGGSATGFHITDKAAPEIRVTRDVDIIVEVASIVDYHRLELKPEYSEESNEDFTPSQMLAQHPLYFL